MTHLRPADASDLDTVVTWVTTQDECDRWTGGTVRYPVDGQTLLQDIGWTTAENWCLDHHGRVTGFGQVVSKPDLRRHIARVIVDPAYRGVGLGRVLMSGLVNVALGYAPRCVSLNVHPSNVPARTLYASLGFREVHNRQENRDGMWVYMERPAGA